MAVKIIYNLRKKARKIAHWNPRLSRFFHPRSVGRHDSMKSFETFPWQFKRPPPTTPQPSFNIKNRGGRGIISSVLAFQSIITGLAEAAQRWTDILCGLANRSAARPTFRAVRPQSRSMSGKSFLCPSGPSGLESPCLSPIATPAPALAEVGGLFRPGWEK